MRKKGKLMSHEKVCCGSVRNEHDGVSTGMSVCCSWWTAGYGGSDRLISPDNNLVAR